MPADAVMHDVYAPAQRAEAGLTPLRAVQRALGRLWPSARAGQVAAALANAEFAARLAEAAQIWATHLGTAQTQMRDATEQMLLCFQQILTQLDAIIDPDSPGTAAGSPAQALDRRAAVLEQCETQLRGLLTNFDGFVKSRDEIMGSVRALAGASSSLGTMAEDVAKLARQTNLLSLNAAIEAARAGTSGRGFAVVATEVRRLSTESGDTGKRIRDQVNDFGSAMREALKQAAAHTEHDAGVIHASEATINSVVGQVDGAVAQLNQRAAELSARGEAVRALVEQLMVAFQFQDRVQQIVDQVKHSMTRAVTSLGQALAEGVAPPAAAWQALLSAGYATDEQRAVSDGRAAAAPRADKHETTFF